ncbi:MAG: adenine deaminase [Pseudomonadota bacterium]
MARAVDLGRRIDQGRGLEPADLVIRGARILAVADGSLDVGDVAIAGDTIVGVYDRYAGKHVIEAEGRIVAPGFIDTHVHLESSMVAPAEFERLVLPRGTTTAVWDPHELANVLGTRGLDYALAAAERLWMTVRVNLSSCVPSSPLETSGARLEAADLVPFLDLPLTLGLAEVMNVPGVLAKDPGLLAKLEAFAGRHVDGHCPLLQGPDLAAYVAAGIRTDHECTRLEEAREKLRKGLAILMREGSVAKNVTTLAPLLTEQTWMRIAFCTDDRNPLEILDEGHVDHALRLAIRAGTPPLAAYRSATFGAAQIMGLHDRGIVAPGMRADLVLLDDLESVAIDHVICAGRVVGALPPVGETSPTGRGSVTRPRATAATFAMADTGPRPVIGARRFSLITDRLERTPRVVDGQAVAGDGLLQLAVLERHGRNGDVGLAFVEGFGELEGAIGASVGHDSHNLIVVGSTPEAMAVAVNRLIDLEGGAVVVRGEEVAAELALPVAGLMSDEPYEVAAAAMTALRHQAADAGCTLPEPLLHLAFLPLVVIPHLKLSDQGLVDVDAFALL